MKLIGFSGKMGAGKSTAVDLVRKLTNGPGGHGVLLFKFAQPLYDMQEMIYDRISSVHKRPDFFVKDRPLLQWLGTDWGRDTISETLWVDLWRHEVKNHAEWYPDTTLLCDDVRFNNEAEALKELGGHVIEITSDRAEARIDTKAGIAGHASENGIDSKYISATIDNSGTVEELEGLLRAFNAAHKVW